MTFGEAISNGFSNYTNFRDRTPRSGFWWWFLFTQIVNIVAQVLMGVFAAMGQTAALIGAIIVLVVILGLLIPGIAVSVRRLHDLDKSGWWLLICLIPLVGAIILIVWFCTKGTEGPNRFGTDPLAATPPAPMPTV